MHTTDPAALYDLVPRAALADLEYLAGLAATEGRPTDWDRYEAQLPQDGFGLLGLYCRACLNGPCRVSPFGRPGSGGGGRSQSGVCGFGAVEMSLAYMAETVGRGLTSIAVSSGAAPISGNLFQTAGKLLASVCPGSSSGEDLARALFEAAGEAAGHLAELHQACPKPSAMANPPVGLGHLAPGSPRVLVTGGDWQEVEGVGQLAAQARERSIQIVASASTAGAFEAGIPVVVDRQSAPLLAASRLVDAVADLSQVVDAGAIRACLDRCVETADHRRDLPKPSAECSPGAGSLLPWQGELTGLLIGGSSKIRSFLGRGGYHQALVNAAAQRSLPITGLGDAAYYLSPLAGTMDIKAASAGLVLPALLRRRASGTAPEALLAFPEPAFADEYATALAMAAAGVRVFLGGELPLAPEAACLLAETFRGTLTLHSGHSVPPGVPSATQALAAATAWLTVAESSEG